MRAATNSVAISNIVQRNKTTFKICILIFLLAFVMFPREYAFSHCECGLYYLMKMPKKSRSFVKMNQAVQGMLCKEFWRVYVEKMYRVHGLVQKQHGNT
jgi:hypothetical protein